MDKSVIQHTQISIPHLLVILLLTWLAWKLWSFVRPRNRHTLRSVAILVLGDIGRSPRMMYHAQSFAENGFVTDIIGYGGLYLHRLTWSSN